MIKSSLKINQKLLFVTKVAQMVLEKTKSFFGLMLKHANCTDKSTISKLSIFVQFCGVTNNANVLN